MGADVVSEVSAKAKGADGEWRELMELSLISLFSIIASWTGHAHWLKDRLSLQPIIVPAMRWIRKLPKVVREKVAAKINPYLLFGGILAVVGPDVVEEFKLRRRQSERPIRPAGFERQSQGHQGPSNPAVQPGGQPAGHREPDAINVTAPPAELIGADV